jgi:hypothetical protein
VEKKSVACVETRHRHLRTCQCSGRDDSSARLGG